MCFRLNTYTLEMFQEWIVQDLRLCYTRVGGEVLDERVQIRGIRDAEHMRTIFKRLKAFARGCGYHEASSIGVAMSKQSDKSASSASKPKRSRLAQHAESTPQSRWTPQSRCFPHAGPANLLFRRPAEDKVQYRDATNQLNG